MKEITAAGQLEVVERVTRLVEDAAQIVGDDASLDVLEGAEAKNLSELARSLSNARVMLRELRRQLKARAIDRV